MDGMSEKQVQKIIDFLLDFLMWVIGINIGVMIIYSCVYLILQVAGSGEEAISGILSNLDEIFPTIQRILGIVSLPVALLMAYLKLKRRRLGENLPEASITTEDVPERGELSRQTKRRLVTMLTNLMRVIGVMLAIVIAIQLLKIITAHFEIGFTVAAIVMIVIGIIVLALLSVLVHKIANE